MVSLIVRAAVVVCFAIVMLFFFKVFSMDGDTARGVAFLGFLLWSADVLFAEWGPAPYRRQPPPPPQ